MNQKDITAFLEKKKVPFELISHKEVYTADKIAKACKVPEKSVVKSLILKANGKKFVMVVLPGNLAAKLTRVRKFLELKTLELAKESEMRKKTTFKPGAAPALGKLLKMMVVADATLEKAKYMVFAAGDYKTCIKINSLDWFKLESPEVLDFSVKPSKKRKKKKAKKKPVKTMFKKPTKKKSIKKKRK